MALRWSCNAANIHGWMRDGGETPTERTDPGLLSFSAAHKSVEALPWVEHALSPTVCVPACGAPAPTLPTPAGMQARARRRPQARPPATAAAGGPHARVTTRPHLPPAEVWGAGHGATPSVQSHASTLNHPCIPPVQ
eukprot:364365-Chlamydomonas_euryale.AAC.2